MVVDCSLDIVEFEGLVDVDLELVVNALASPLLDGVELLLVERLEPGAQPEAPDVLVLEDEVRGLQTLDLLAREDAVYIGARPRRQCPDDLAGQLSCNRIEERYSLLFGQHLLQLFNKIAVLLVQHHMCAQLLQLLNLIRLSHNADHLDPVLVEYLRGDPAHSGVAGRKHNSADVLLFLGDVEEALSGYGVDPGGGGLLQFVLFVGFEEEVLVDCDLLGPGAVLRGVVWNVGDWLAHQMLVRVWGGFDDSRALKSHHNRGFVLHSVEACGVHYVGGVDCALVGLDEQLFWVGLGDGDFPHAQLFAVFE